MLRLSARYCCRHPLIMLPRISTPGSVVRIGKVVMGEMPREGPQVVVAVTSNIRARKSDVRAVFVKRVLVGAIMGDGGVQLPKTLTFVRTDPQHAGRSPAEKDVYIRQLHAEGAQTMLRKRHKALTQGGSRIG